MVEQEFEYLVPTCVDEAIALRERFGEGSRFIGGGTEIVPLITRGKLPKTRLIELTELEELKSLRQDDDGLRIGAGVTLSRLEQSPLLQDQWHALAEAAGSIREPQVRNRGTIGGNVAHGVPSADLVPPLLAFGAVLTLRAAKGQRLLPLEEFLVGPYRTRLLPDELVVEILLPRKERKPGSAFLKLTRFGGSGLSVATVAAAVSMQDDRIASARIAFGSAGPVPRRVAAAEEFLAGKRPDDEVLSEAGRLVSEVAEPREGSIRATPRHRRLVLKPLTERAIAAAAKRANARSSGDSR